MSGRDVDMRWTQVPIGTDRRVTERCVSLEAPGWRAAWLNGKTWPGVSQTVCTTAHPARRRGGWSESRVRSADVYDSCRRTFLAECDMEPSLETTAIYQSGVEPFKRTAAPRSGSL